MQVRPPGAEPGRAKSKILPRVGAPFDIQGERNGFVTPGDVGTPHADSFYLVSDEDSGVRPQGITLRLLHKGAAGFVELPALVTMEGGTCLGLFRVQTGHVMYCDVQGQRALALVLVDGAVVSPPCLKPLVGLQTEVSTHGWTFRVGGGLFYLLGVGAKGPVLLRHDGVTQVGIAIDPRISVLGVTVAPSGDLHMLGVYTDTNHRVRAVARVGSAALEIVEVAGLVVAEALVFVQLK